MLGEALLAQASSSPDRVAVRAGGDTLTYAALHARAADVAARVIAASAPGGTAGRRVAVLLPRGTAQVVALVGTALSGAAQLAVDVANPPPRARWLLADFAPHLLITDAATDAPGDVAPGVPRLWLDAAGGPVSVPTRPGAPPRVPAGRGGHPAPATAPAASPGDTAYFVYTSGSTGRPKATLITHDGIMSRLCWLQRSHRLTADDRVLYSSSCGFDASVAELYWPLTTGSQLVVAGQGAQRDPDHLADLIARHRVSVLQMVPSLLDLLLQGRPRDERYDGLRLVLAGGERLPPALLARLHRRTTATVVNLYGPSECAVYATAWRCPRDPDPTETLIGTAVGETELVVLGPDGAEADEGELYIGGVGVGVGYWNRPELTASAFLDRLGTRTGRFYRTGDLVARRADGNLAYLGRTDRQVKVRGHRIEPAEVERAVLADPEVRQVAVVPVERGSGTVLAASLVLSRGADPAVVLDRLKRRLRGELPDHLRPALLRPCARLPVTANGKADVLALTESCAAHLADTPAPTADPAGATAPSRTERLVIDTWRAALRVPDVGTDDDFFDLGGDSFAALSVVRALEKELHRELRVSLLYTHPTVTELAAALDRRP
ncbi:hypothetical protein AQ490_11300 [Wenjunlia vitaminophila]|uniref:Carrier domain-containing protein n=1 Tax=Wenjunlia vitaminophila TaxID=76728 RepID=A0A0T6LK58_WENVI|nr:amino acid adenylation domain-containing protein [Wenjunlia vitaminophila]KRV46477.1 hypothetical protein AQ490_11300 [Wenjunlia vitaminophila]